MFYVAFRDRCHTLFTSLSLFTLQSFSLFTGLHKQPVTAVSCQSLEGKGHEILFLLYQFLVWLPVSV